VKQDVQLFIPTAFTPNDDKLNDYFEVNILGSEAIEVFIFNRWGERIYYNANQHNGIQNNGDAWDGKRDGKTLPYDTYIYQLNIKFFDGTVKTVSGSITLMK
jgi:gliding motility-associated-like protein